MMLQAVGTSRLDKDSAAKRVGVRCCCSGLTEPFETSDAADFGVASGAVVPVGSVLNLVRLVKADVHEQLYSVVQKGNPSEDIDGEYSDLQVSQGVQRLL